MRLETRLLLVLLLLGGCSFGDEDAAGSVSGPGTDVHCAALEPRVGATTVVVRCPGSTP